MTVPNPPQGTTVPAAVAAIMTGLGTVNFAGATLMLGLPPQWPKIDAVCIAASDGSTPGIRHNLTRDDRTMGYSESFDIVCALWSWRSDTNMQAAVTRCGDLFNGVKAWLVANRELGGIVYRATLADQVPWVPINRGDGAQCTVGFSIHVIVSI